MNRRRFLAILGGVAAVAVSGWQVLRWATKKSPRSPVPDAAGMKARIQQDFAADEFEIVDGWVLSRTEAAWFESVR